MEFVEILWSHYRSEMIIHRLQIKFRYNPFHTYEIINNYHNRFDIVCNNEVHATCELQFGSQTGEPSGFILAFLKKITSSFKDIVYVHKVVLRHKAKKWNTPYTINNNSIVSENVILLGICSHIKGFDSLVDESTFLSYVNKEYFIYDFDVEVIKLLGNNGSNNQVCHTWVCPPDIERSIPPYVIYLVSGHAMNLKSFKKVVECSKAILYERINKLVF
jgi:hypothetical protein